MRVVVHSLGAAALVLFGAACLPAAEEDSSAPPLMSTPTVPDVTPAVAPPASVDATSPPAAIDAGPLPNVDANTSRAPDAGAAQATEAGAAPCGSARVWDAAALPFVAPARPDVDSGCAADACLNGGQHVQDAFGYRCMCPAGFVGVRCETSRETISCLTETSPIPGYCGGSFCNMSTTRFSLGFAAAGKCGNARDLMCAGTLKSISMQCMINAALSADATGEATACIKADRTVEADHLSDGCIGCFVMAGECCKQDNTCISACVLGPSKACDDAQRDAGCLTALHACAGLPTPM
jgi:hypothetical protein